MDIGSIFLILALAILVGLFILRPLFTLDPALSKGKSRLQDDQALSTLLAERDRAVNALQELDFDFILGKIPEDDYPVQRIGLLKRGAEILRQIDQGQGVQVTQGAEERLEATLVERRRMRSAVGGNGAGMNGNSHPPDDPLESLIAARRRSRQEKAAGFCHKCGGPLQKSDRFCPKCGASIGE